MLENKEKVRILKESLKIVDRLALIDVNDIEDLGDNLDVDYGVLVELIKKAKTLRQNRLWKLI